LIPLKDNIPTDRLPVITILIIAINVAVFLFLQSPSLSGEQVKNKTVVEYGAIPYRVTHPGKSCDLAAVEVQPGFAVQDVVCEGKPPTDPVVARENIKDTPPFLTLFTSMFMHGGWLHIGFNMLFLWIFGNNVEDSMGRPRFLLFYLLAGIAAGYAQALLNPDATLPAIGASGAIAGVLGGYILLYPRARVLTLVFIVFFFTLIEIPAMIVLAVWFILQAIPAVGQVATPDVAGGAGVAYWAHVGGFAFGLAAIKLFANRYRAGAIHA
jgi:membrane associated rhomboid family serine protease